MKDEFPKTRYFCVVLGNVSSRILSIIKSDNSHASEYYQSMYNRALDAREREIYELEEEYGYAEWTMENRPVIIRELLDSVEYRSDLQEAYDVWIKMLSEVETYDDHHFELMFGNRAKITAVDERGRRLLKEIRSIMKCVYIFAQELKLEFDLWDKEEYNWSPAFLPFYDEVKYVNGPNVKPAESEEEKEPRTIPPNVIMAFRSAEAAEQFFAWKPYTTKPWDWGKRYKQYGINEQARTRGCIKAVFEFLRQQHPDVEDRINTFQKSIKN